MWREGADMTEHTVELQRFGAEDAANAAEEVTSLYRLVYGAEEPAASDPFHSRERFLDRFAGYQRGAGFTLIVARSGGELVGFAYGYQLAAEARWWAGNEPPISADIAARTRTGAFFALNDIAVHPRFRQRGIAEALHRELLATQDGRSITLLVELDNAPAAAAYEKWGYKPIGTQQPFPDSPVYRTMVLNRPADAAVRSSSGPALRPASAAHQRAAASAPDARRR